MRFMLLLLLLVSPVFGADTTNEVSSVQVLIDRFDDTGFVYIADPVWDTVPNFVSYAKEAASFGECAIDPLIEALGGSRQSRLAAAIGLEAVGPLAIRARSKLIEMFENGGRDSILVCGIIRGIGPNATEFVPQLRPLLSADNFHVQYWACRALSSIGPGAEEAIPDLISALKNGLASVRRNAAIALGNIAGELDDMQFVIDALEQAQHDYSVPIRQAAVEALTKLQEKEYDVN